MICPTILEIIHSLKLVDYLHVQADKHILQVIMIVKFNGSFLKSAKFLLNWLLFSLFMLFRGYYSFHEFENKDLKL